MPRKNPDEQRAYEREYLPRRRIVRSRWRALNRAALNLARNLEIPIGEARKFLSSVGGSHVVTSSNDEGTRG